MHGQFGSNQASMSMKAEKPEKRRPKKPDKAPEHTGGAGDFIIGYTGYTYIYIYIYI